jgi:mannose-1-phosphate guanylyltransferase
MKAFLLAAGIGTRLRPLTHHTPKCLIPINGRPLMEYWFDLFDRYGIDEILINTSYLSDKVRDYLSEHSRGLNISLTYEETLLGSGGTIKENQSFVKGEDVFSSVTQTILQILILKKSYSFMRKIKKKLHWRFLRYQTLMNAVLWRWMSSPRYCLLKKNLKTLFQTLPLQA